MNPGEDLKSEATKKRKENGVPENKKVELTKGFDTGKLCFVWARGGWL